MLRFTSSQIHYHLWPYHFMSLGSFWWDWKWNLLSVGRPSIPATRGWGLQTLCLLQPAALPPPRFPQNWQLSQASEVPPNPRRQLLSTHWPNHLLKSFIMVFLLLCHFSLQSLWKVTLYSIRIISKFQACLCEFWLQALAPFILVF